MLFSEFVSEGTKLPFNYPAEAVCILLGLLEISSWKSRYYRKSFQTLTLLTAKCVCVCMCARMHMYSYRGRASGRKRLKRNEYISQLSNRRSGVDVSWRGRGNWSTFNPFVSCIVGLGTILGFNFQRKVHGNLAVPWENASWAHDLFIPSTSAPVSALSCQSLDFKEA